MNFFIRIWIILKSIFFPSKDDDSEEIDIFEGLTDEQLQEIEEKFDIAKRTLTTKLYSIEQDIAVFQDTFPDKYKSYLNRIDELRRDYLSGVDQLDEELRFDIDPEEDGRRLAEVMALEKEVKSFIEKEVKFEIISTKLQKLIIKLNILYNTTVVHNKEEDKKKAVSQLNHVFDSELRIVDEFKKCDYILNNRHLKERIINLLSYLDYLIYKVGIKNSNDDPKNIICKLILVNEFKGFDYLSSFKDFIRDEITDFEEILPLISDLEFRKIFEKKFKSLLTELTYSEDPSTQLLDGVFWNNFLTAESNFLEVLRGSGVDKEKARVGLIRKMNIEVKADDVLTSPIITAYLSLSNVYSITHDENILPVIKILKNISNNVTYREIYYLLVLFDVIFALKTTNNELYRYIEKYVNEYPYSETKLKDKKKQVKNITNKEYVIAFSIGEYERDIIKTLYALNLDFKIVSGNVILLNSFYFLGLSNITSSLKKYNYTTED